MKKQKVTAITFAKASVAVQKGKKVSNPAIVTPTYAANKKITYKSSRTSVATVSTSGVVTGKKSEQLRSQQQQPMDQRRKTVTK